MFVSARFLRKVGDLTCRNTCARPSEDAQNISQTSDTRINRLKSAADRILPTTGALSQMGMEHVQQFEDINEPTQSISGKVEGDHVTKTGKNSANQETRDSASSPTKKRSRDKGC